MLHTGMRSASPDRAVDSNPDGNGKKARMSIESARSADKDKAPGANNPC
jgi:hypothetical protein